MKKAQILIAIFLGVTRIGYSQPNGGFENWITEFSYEVPVDWQTLNFLQFVAPPNPLSAFKATGIDKHSGNYALKLKSIYVQTNPSPSIFNDTMGVSFTGLINISPTYYRYGFAYASRPEKLNFWYKYLPVGSDIGGVRVLLTKWNGVKQDTVAYIDTIFYQTPSYSVFELPITYLLEDLPDTAAIFVASSRYSSLARVASTLYLDDVAFSGWVGMDENKLHSIKVKAFPNPANENITILVQNAYTYSIVLTEITGRKVGEYTITNDRVNIDTRQFKNGLYFYEIKNEKNVSIANGKFNVSK